MCEVIVVFFFLLALCFCECFFFLILCFIVCVCFFICGCLLGFLYVCIFFSIYFYFFLTFPPSFVFTDEVNDFNNFTLISSWFHFFNFSSFWLPLFGCFRIAFVPFKSGNFHSSPNFNNFTLISSWFHFSTFRLFVYRFWVVSSWYLIS